MVNRLSTRAIRGAAMAVSALSMAACASTKAPNSASAGKDDYRASIGAFANPASDENLDPVAAAAFWGTRYNRDQESPETAVKFSSALRKIGSLDEAIGVMQKASVKFPEDTDVRLELSKALIENGRAFEAVRHIETAAVQRPDDWRVQSAYGVALDQIGEHKTARTKYDRALALAPGAATVLNNKGLSFAMEGDLSLARQTLRLATSSAGATARIRQNLALVLAISGDMTSAERLARSDLPPQVADNNIDYFRAIVNQPAYWSEYADTGVDVPSFDGAPAAPTQSPSAPSLRTPPEAEEAPQKNDGSPIALGEPTAVTNASAPASLTPFSLPQDMPVEVTDPAGTVPGASIYNDEMVDGVELKPED